MNTSISQVATLADNLDGGKKAMKPCAANETRNPQTNRCRKRCSKTQKRSKKTGRCIQKSRKRSVTKMASPKKSPMQRMSPKKRMSPMRRATPMRMPARMQTRMQTRRPSFYDEELVPSVPSSILTASIETAEEAIEQLIAQAKRNEAEDEYLNQLYREEGETGLRAFLRQTAEVPAVIQAERDIVRSLSNDGKVSNEELAMINTDAQSVVSDYSTSTPVFTRLLRNLGLVPYPRSPSVSTRSRSPSTFRTARSRNSAAAALGFYDEERSPSALAIRNSQSASTLRNSQSTR